MAPDPHFRVKILRDLADEGPKTAYSLAMTHGSYIYAAMREMIRLGHVKGSKMVDMQLTNRKLVDRGTRMIMEETGIEDYDLARKLLLEYGQVRAAVVAWQGRQTFQA